MATLSGTVPPQGSVAGNLNDTYLDTTTSILYTCVESGTALTAVWLASIKWSSFPNVGNILNTDTLVGLRTGGNVRFNTSNILLSNNNLSDVQDSNVSRTNLSAQRQAITVSSDPNGTQAGSLGDHAVISSTQQIWECTTSGTASTAVWTLLSTPINSLLKSNNLLDVASASASLSNIGGQPVNLSGSVDPNGNVAGTAGISFYFNTSTLQLWRCIVTGTSSTAFWILVDNNGNIQQIDLVSASPVQLLSNKLYVGRITSPGPAIGIMTISPVSGDSLLIYAYASAGVTINRGTSGSVRIVDVSVSSSFFIPFGSYIVLRCVTTLSGGQWAAESICGPVTVDGSITENSIGNVQLNKSNNLSDVSSASTSLSNIGGQPINITGIGNPNGSVAGTAGINFYFDNSSLQLWRCVNTGTTSTAVWSNLSASLSPANILYFSSAIGNDTTGTGSIASPFATYSKATSVALLSAGTTNRYAVYPMGNETVSGNIILYPEVSIVGEDPLVNSLTTTNDIVLSPNFSISVSNTFSATNVGFYASNCNLNVTNNNGSSIFFTNSPIFSSNINITGSSSGSDFFLYNNSIYPSLSNNINATNTVAIIDSIVLSSITLISNSSSKGSALLNIDNGIVDSIPVIVRTVSPGAGCSYFSCNSANSSITVDGSQSFAFIDDVGYTSSLTFLNGATINSNIEVAGVSDSTKVTYTPTNYTLIPGVTYQTISATNHFVGIDNEIGVLKSGALVKADSFGFTDISLPAGGNIFLSFPNVRIDTSSIYNSSTSICTVNKTGYYEVNYGFDSSGIGSSLISNYWIDSAIYINGSYDQSDYSTNRNSAVGIAEIIQTTNNQSNIFLLNVGDTIGIRSVNNGNIPLTISHRVFNVKFLRS